VASELDDPFNLPIWLRGIAQAYCSIGEETQALAFFDKEINFQKARGNQKGQRIAYERIGDLLSSSRQFEKALPSYRNAYLISCNQSDLQIQQSHLSDLAANLYNMGRFTEAKTHFRRCLNLARTLEDSSLVIDRLDDIGDCQLALGKNISASRSYLTALSISRKILRSVMYLGSTENILDLCENNSRIVNKLNESTRSTELAKYEQLFIRYSSSSFRIEAMARLSTRTG
jgi:tetratricopeptide (TPR) repeat protein